MPKGSGKVFEVCYKDSTPDYCYLVRLNDPPQSFGGGTAKFSLKNPYDYLCFDTKHRILIPTELKTTKYKSMSLSMIREHQIEGLTKASAYDNMFPCFLFNFRDEDSGVERCYAQHIVDFNKMIHDIDKKSFNEVDLLSYGAIKLDGKKKVKYYRWDIDKLCEDIAKKFDNK